MQPLYSDIKKLKILLVLLTLFTVGFFVLIFLDYFHIGLRPYQEPEMVLFLLVYYTSIGIFIWFIWNRMPVSRKTKWNDTIMILCLKVIGMWLWLPNQNQLLNEKREERV